MLAAGLGGLIVPVFAQNGTAGSEDRGTSTGHTGRGMMVGGMMSRGMMAGCSEMMHSMNAASSGRSTQSWASFSPMPKPCSLPVSSAYRWTILRARPSPTPSIHNTEPITMDDVIIIGGSFAGLAGALQLGRARRKVTVLDTGLPRNRFAGHSHGLLAGGRTPGAVRCYAPPSFGTAPLPAEQAFALSEPSENCPNSRPHSFPD